MSNLRLNADIIDLKPRHPFIIARGSQDTDRTVAIRLVDQDGVEGWGEAAPQRYYGETPETVLAALDVYAQVLPEDPLKLEEAEAAFELALHGNNSARAALSTALHDLAGKRLGVPVYKLWGLDAAKCPMSTFTIGIDTPERIKLKVSEAEQYPILKIKLGTADDLAILRAIRAVTRKELRVDANAGGTRKQAIKVPRVLGGCGVRGREQPPAPGDGGAPPAVPRHSRI